jgi:CheY-like chemotaxis protein
MTRPEDKTILVVDDEPNVRQYLETVLRDAGFNVETAADGEEALARIKQHPPDFISLDLIMPRKSGHRLLYELKRHREWSRIPVLVVTAHARDDLGKGDLSDLLENRVMSGPGTYLEKPVNPRTYVRSIMRTLGIEPPPEADEKIDLKDKLQQSIEGADPEALRRALAALEKGGKR